MAFSLRCRFHIASNAIIDKFWHILILITELMSSKWFVLLIFTFIKGLNVKACTSPDLVLVKKTCPGFDVQPSRTDTTSFIHLHPTLVSNMAEGLD